MNQEGAKAGGSFSNNLKHVKSLRRACSEPSRSSRSLFKMEIDEGLERPDMSLFHQTPKPINFGTPGDDSNERFDISQFLQLPWNVIREILSYLPLEFRNDVFWCIPRLRRMLIEECVMIISSRSTNDSSILRHSIEADANVLSFLQTNPGVAPKKIYIVAKDAASIKSRMRAHQDAISSTPYLGFRFELGWCHDFDKKCFELMSRFPNLRELQISFSAATHPRRVTESLDTLSGVETMSIHGTESSDWTGIKLPDYLRKLRVKSCNINTLVIPPRVEQLKLRCINGYEFSSGNFTLPSSLTCLSITYCALTSLSLTDLPQSLKHIEIHHCDLKEIYCEDEAKWPPKLEYLDLSSNEIHDDSLLAIAEGHLPSGLRTLKLHSNKFFSLHAFKPFPESLKLLQISSNVLWGMGGMERIESQSGSSFQGIQFPDGLETLHISHTFLTKEGYSDSMSQKKKQTVFRSLSASRRIQFPKMLKALYLENIWDFHLEHCAFPQSLEKLSLSFSGIPKLSSYDFRAKRNARSDEQSISWNDLKRLKELHLEDTGLKAVDWKAPPPNLVSFVIDGVQHSKSCSEIIKDPSREDTSRRVMPKPVPVLGP